MTYSVRNIVIALVLAAVAAGLVILYTGNVKKQAHDSSRTSPSWSPSRPSPPVARSAS